MGAELLGLLFISMRVKLSERNTELQDEDRFPMALFEDPTMSTMPEDNILSAFQSTDSLSLLRLTVLSFYHSKLKGTGNQRVTGTCPESSSRLMAGVCQHYPFPCSTWSVQGWEGLGAGAGEWLGWGSWERYLGPGAGGQQR